MRVLIFATASVALALEEADQDVFVEHLSLLQLSARPHSETVAENSDDLDAHDVDDLDSAGYPMPITWDNHRSFGPDGTWATPYCKNIQGCTVAERKCPPGCDGTAYWEPPTYGNSRLGIPNTGKVGAHYLGCAQGVNRGGSTFGSWNGPSHRQQNCNGGPDSNKPALDSSDAAWVKQNIGNVPFGVDTSQLAYQNENCPADCVNDCAQFKMGMFSACGSTMGVSWAGYNGGYTNAVGPNARCPLGSIGKFGYITYTWCGERTTTTTTTPPPVEEPELPVGDEASAAGDPHMTSNTGHHFDLE